MLVNDVISWNEKQLRILRFENDRVFLYPMEKEVCSYITVEKNDFDLAVSNGEATKVQDPYEKLRFKTLRGKMQERAQENYKLIEPIVRNEAILFNKRYRAEEIERIAVHTKSSTRTLRRYIAAWWRRGQMKNALAPSYGTNAGKSFAGRKIGRPGKDGVRTAATADMKKDFDRIIRKYVFAGRDSMSLDRAHSAYLAEFRRQHPDADESEAGSLWQFQYFFKKNYTPAEKARGRSSRIAYAKDYRSLTGTIYDVVRAPGSIYEIDSTPDNITLVSEADRTKIIGRPVLYLVADVYTGMIAGFSLQFENASFDMAADAIYNAISDKVALCKKYDIEIDEEQWPIKGVPAKIVADNGELRSDQIQNLCTAYNVEASLTAPYHADMKPVVERAIGLVQQELRHFVTGVKDPIALKKAGGKDARLDATLTLKEYTQAVIRVIIALNHRVRQCTPAALPANIKPTPLELWNWAKGRGNSDLRSAGTGNLRMVLSRHFDCTFSKYGINVEGIRYFCDRANELGYFDRYLRNERPKNMKMVVEPSNVSKAWLIPNPEKEPNVCWECRLAPTSRALEGKTWIEAKDYLKEASATRSQARDEMAIVRSHLQEALQKMKESAKQSKPADNRSKAKKVSEIAENRHNERIQQQASNPKLLDNPDEQPKAFEGQSKTPEEQPAKRKHRNYPDSFDDIYD